jgi:hypothetical protein
MSAVPSSRLLGSIVPVFWAFAAVAVTITWAAAIALQWQLLISICHPASTCANFQLNADTARTLGEHGISPTIYAMYTVVVVVVVWSIWCGLATLIILRRAEDRGALVSAYFLILFPLFEISFWLPSSPPIAVLVTNVMGKISFASLFMFCLLFPDGRFVPRWTKWLALILLLAGVISDLLSLNISVISPILLLVLLVAALWGQIYRFRSVSSWGQRQQTKWALFGLSITIVGFAALIVPFAVQPNLGESGTPYEVFTVTAVPLVTTVIPVSIGIAVLRNRLWDIDRVISRALAYTVLTATLGVIYVGSVILLQNLSDLVAGSSSVPAVALSTLAVAALFGPLRRRIQNAIDRRFYRAKYDAARTLAAFGERLRDEVDLTHLSQELTSEVHATLKPEQVTLWLRDASSNTGSNSLESSRTQS